ncbi:NACHT domain-containing protein [Corallococcus caeni]|uniref:AAA+ ATPase domain-containing protein n=1 Tax=Corallococcus caeni TaxID=3082388 RepID=A0ABQ6QJ30_9BACT|nr:hypothetical protein ASNO1_02840 [Corallococcus sp. NO1]
MVSAKQAQDSLAKNLATDADIIKEFATAIALPTVLLTLTNPTPLSIGSALLVAAAAGVKSFSKVLERLEPTDAEPPKFETTYERFKVAYYTLAQRTVVEAITQNQQLSRALKSLTDTTLDARKTEQFKRIVAERAAAIGEAELRFHYTVAPTDKQLAIHGAYQDWLSSTLEYLGVSNAERISSEVMNEARTRFKFSLASAEPLPTWMRNYLALEQGSQFTETALLQLNAIRETLDGWKKEATHTGFRPSRWDRYRGYLQSLPDQRDTMYNEEFGVSRVFVAPRIKYHRTGLLGIADTPQDVPDVGRLIGALVSTRVEDASLIILSGGPGSGKSTLCRMIASELARDPSVHPVFLRLRRQKEGADVTGFIEEHLVSEDVIGRISDLHQVPNLILILDGFDELVMASKSRLRTFFTSLLDAASHGPLRSAKFIISGRDTLFPGGAGLPRGSHLLTVLPFDRDRVAAWGERWRTALPEGLGTTFYPEAMLDPSERKNSKSQGALHQLATWPLTLHLIAQLHTAGRMAVGDPKFRTIEKAYIYRAILAETARRQTEQTSGRGRLDSEAMRKFLRAIAWEMYVRTTDTLDIEAVVPIVKKLFPNYEDTMISELAEVAVVNAPEIKKGEETGFEFVHKSFSEFLATETIAQELDVAVHRVQDVSGGEVWHQSTEDVAKSLIYLFGPRLIPVEVEDMLRPMAGGFRYFIRGTNVGDQPERHLFELGLKRLLERTQELYRFAIDGKLLSHYEDSHKRLQRGRNPLEVGANFSTSIVLTGTIAAERLREKSDVDATPQPPAFQLEPVDGGMWRWLFMASAGGVQIDEALARRLFRCTKVSGNSETSTASDFSLPIQLGLLTKIEGYESSIAREVKTARNASFALSSRAALLCTLLDAASSEPPASPMDTSQSGISRQKERHFTDTSHFAEHLLDLTMDVFERLLTHLAEAGLVPREMAGHRKHQRRVHQDQLLARLREDNSTQRGELVNLIGSICSSLCQRRPDVLQGTGEELIHALDSKIDFSEALLESIRTEGRRIRQARQSKSEPES